MDTANQPQHEEPAGRSPENFARAAGISRTTLYMLPDECKPASFKVGRRVVITERPVDWVARMAARGGTETLKPAKAA